MDEISDQAAQRASQVLTTEHFTLQGARNATISEANGRLGHYISIVGSSVVALAFVANVSGMGSVFFAFSLVIFPILIVLGVVTLIRTIQIGVDFVRLTQAINRIRHYYVEVAPEVKPYLSFPATDDPDSVQRTMMPFHSPLQALASTPGPVILINSVVAGAFAGILASTLFSIELVMALVIALGALVTMFILQMVYSGRLWKQSAAEALDVRFPSAKE